MPELVFRFLVKFYTPDPELLEEELTRLVHVCEMNDQMWSGHYTLLTHVLLASQGPDMHWFDVVGPSGVVCCPSRGHISKTKQDRPMVII